MFQAGAYLLRNQDTSLERSADALLRTVPLTFLNQQR